MQLLANQYLRLLSYFYSSDRGIVCADCLALIQHVASLSIFIN